MQLKNHGGVTWRETATKKVMLLYKQVKYIKKNYHKEARVKNKTKNTKN